MIKQHLSFEYIPDDTVLWQYMSLTKFLYLIKNKKLHLHRLDDLMDQEEGVLSVLDKKSLSFYKGTPEEEKYLEDDRKRTFISCWIRYPIEQSLMWYAYGKDGVAIRSTAAAIRKAMEVDKEHIVRMIGVRYVDKDRQAVLTTGEATNWYHFYSTKRKFFEMENEVRLIFHDDDRKYKNKGVDFDVDIETLIDEIKVASTAPEYIYNLICQESRDAGIKVVPNLSDI